VVKKNLLVLIGFFVRGLLVIVMFGGLFYAIISLNPRYKTHFERIIVGRFDKSSGSRFNLWQRGIGVLMDHSAIFWGVGPENFRVLDPAQTDNQLHNDTLAFLVERGLIGLLGLALFAGIALRRAFSLLWMVAREPERYRLEVVVFLGAIVAVMIESLTHQVFRTRELWLMLALQEAIYLGMITAKNGTPAKPVVNTQPQFQSRMSAQR
jgi:O-antigen ligase